MLEQQLAVAEKAIAMLERQNARLTDELALARRDLASIRTYTTTRMQRAIAAARKRVKHERSKAVPVALSILRS